MQLCITDGNNKHLNVVLHLITEDLISEKDTDEGESDLNILIISNPLI